MKSLLAEAWRLEPFVPPFTFSAFFSPEDTLLCVCAAESARNLLHAWSGGELDLRIAELTSGSGLVGLYLLRETAGERRQAGGGSSLLGLDVDEEAAAIATQNAKTLGIDSRARFVCSDIWSPQTVELLRIEKPQLLVCNPPYVPEPSEKAMEPEAGAGPHGTAHLLRAIELTRELQPDVLALSWCSLSDPMGIIAAAEAAGYHLIDLFVTAIADGEYSGSVHDYLRGLDDCYINEQPDTLAVIASDGAARFAYLLFAGVFVRGRRASLLSPPGPLVKVLCHNFVRDGISALASELPRTAYASVHRYMLTRWDELQLRVMLHGVPTRSARSKA